MPTSTRPWSSGTSAACRPPTSSGTPPPTSPATSSSWPASPPTSRSPSRPGRSAARCTRSSSPATNLPGSVACVTTALAADRFDLEDVQIASYEDPSDADAGAEPGRSSCSASPAPADAHPAADLADALRGRLLPAFAHLARGEFLDAQAAAAAHRLTPAGETVRDGEDAPAALRASVGLLLGGDYRLERRLASGGMSEIYLATQISLDRTVAVKIAREDSPADSDMAARFAREAVVLAQFNCPYIVPVLAAGTEPSGTGVLGWIAMEYEAGGDLARWLDAAGAAARSELGLRWFRQALEALRYAHRNAVLHRDLKPHNLLLTADGNVKVGDFGLFKRVRAERPGPAGGPGRSTARRTTCRRSRPAANTSTSGPTSSRSARRSSTCSAASCRSSTPARAS